MLLHIFVLDMYHLVFLMSTFLGQDYDAVAYFVLDLYNIVFLSYHSFWARIVMLLHIFVLSYHFTLIKVGYSKMIRWKVDD